jgi:hypothetical protein
LKYLQNVHLYHFCLNFLHNILQKSGFRLILGTDGCKVVCMKGDFSNNFTNEYEKTLNYLLDLESLCSKGISKSKLKYKLFYISVKLLNATKTASIAKTLIDKIDKKKSF